ncbi:MAG: anion transporter [Lachnoclostridium sp.]|nr:anion transporter [Lachnoclostridium sp.]
MSIAVALAIITSCISVPKLSYIDFSVLALLFNLMLVTAGFRRLRILDSISVYLLNRCRDERMITAALVLVTLFSSMLVTNDVALITFVPLAIITGRNAGIGVIKIVVLQTLAANLGSSLTPMGNPQNLYLYSFYSMTPAAFFSAIFPLGIGAVILLAALILMVKPRKTVFTLPPVYAGSRKPLPVYAVLFILNLLSVFHAVDYRLVFAITVLAVLIADRGLFRAVDYPLLITFTGFFIFIGNLSHMDSVRLWLEALLGTGTAVYIAGILSSQVISNVPAAILLSGFTARSRELLLAVNIGGMGTLIASLASLISYKIFAKEYPAENGAYMKVFTLYNLAGLALLGAVLFFMTQSAA